MHLRHDLRVVLRGWRRAPGRPIAIVLTLGLALGANSATFSLIDRVALRPLPVEKPHEIVRVTALRLPYPLPSVSVGGGRLKGMSYPLFESLRGELRGSFSAMAAYGPLRLTILAKPAALEILGHAATADYFGVLGVHASIGRTLTPADDGQRDGAAIAVLNHGFWMRQYGGDRSIVGRAIRLNNVAFTVVGVLALGYSGMMAGHAPNVFVPVAMSDQVMPSRRSSPIYAWNGLTYSVYVAIARLTPDCFRRCSWGSDELHFQSFTGAQRSSLTTPTARG